MRRPSPKRRIFSKPAGAGIATGYRSARPARPPDAVFFALRARVLLAIEGEGPPGRAWSEGRGLDLPDVPVDSPCAHDMPVTLERADRPERSLAVDREHA